MTPDRWKEALEQGPKAIRSTNPTYTYQSWDERSHVVEHRTGLSWASACGLLGNQAESDDIACASITRESDGLNVAGYHRQGMD